MVGKKLKHEKSEETKHGLSRDCFLGAPERTEQNCFVSHETGLEGGLVVSVSLVETKHLDFYGFFRVSFPFRPQK